MKRLRLNMAGYRIMFLVLTAAWCFNACTSVCGSTLPVIVTTWKWGLKATQTAWNILSSPKPSAMDALEDGISLTCEQVFCADSVGAFGKRVDERGHVTLDAMIMDGKTHEVGAVGGIKNVTNAISVARAVIKYTKSTLLVGEDATNFAKEMGFKLKDFTSKNSTETFNEWKRANCQPNFRRNVLPDPTKSCGPYRPSDRFDVRGHHIPNPKPRSVPSVTGEPDHDTISMVIVDKDQNVAAGSSTNGLAFKIPGRAGDVPIAGAAAYADNEVGGAAATGNGDIMMRFLPSYQIVESMRHRMSPKAAADDAIGRIAKYYPDFTGAVIAVRKDGRYGVACHNMDSFPFVVQSPAMPEPKLKFQGCFNGSVTNKKRNIIAKKKKVPTATLR